MFSQVSVCPRGGSLFKGGLCPGAVSVRVTPYIVKSEEYASYLIPVGCVLTAAVATIRCHYQMVLGRPLPVCRLGGLPNTLLPQIQTPPGGRPPRQRDTPPWRKNTHPGQND